MAAKQADTYDTAKAWEARLDASWRVFKRVEPMVRKLKDSLRGKFPAVVPGVAAEDLKRHELGRRVEQVNLNVNLRTVTYMRAVAFDEFPQITYPRVGEGDDQLATMNEYLLERVMDEGDCVYEWRAAMLNMFTTGPAIVWQGIERPIASMENLAGTTTTPDEFVHAAAARAELGLAPIDPPKSADQLAIGRVARESLLDETLSRELTRNQRNALLQLAHRTDVLAQAEIDTPRTRIAQRGEVWYQHTPYGTWCLWDHSVWHRPRLDWIARALVLRREEILEDESFSDEFKKQLRALEKTEAEVQPGDGAERIPADDDPNLAEHDNSAIKVWEVWWKGGLKRHYIVKGIDVFGEKESAYPYMGADGQAAIKGFYPCTVVVPLEHDTELPERTIGIPILEPAWPQQIEIIKTRSAYVTAIKKTARIYVAAAGMSNDEIDEIKEGRDGTVVRAPPGLRAGEKPLERMPIGEAPRDYLLASQQLIYDYAQMVGVSLPSLTGQPVADTLGQERIATEAVGVTQGDLVRQVERGFAHCAETTRALIRTFFKRAHVKSYMGDYYAAPRVDAQGNEVPAPFEQWQMTSLHGDKLKATLASRQRGEDPLRIKQIQDFIAQLQADLDAAGVPRWETEPYLNMQAKALELGVLQRYEPTQAELLLALAAAQGGMGQETSEKPQRGGGQRSGRKARGGRGKPSVPGRQRRGRDPRKGDGGTTRANRRSGS